MLQIHRFSKYLFALLLLAVLLFVCGCSSEGLDTVVDKDGITSVSINYMGYTGDDIPRAELASKDGKFATLLDGLFSAEPVRLDVSQSQSYSPEMNASYVLYLHTAVGSMPVYMDEYHHIYSLPVARSEDDRQVRTYVTYQPISADGGVSPIWELIKSLEPAREELQSVLAPTEPAPAAAAQTPNQASELAGFTAPNDSELRAGVDQALISQSGETIPFESNSNSEAASPLYYAFAPGSLSSVSDGRIYIVANPELSAGQTASIASITKVEGALLVRVQINDREDQNQNAALIDQSVLSDGMKVVFLRDDNAELLYVQSYAQPTEG